MELVIPDGVSDNVSADEFAEIISNDGAPSHEWFAIRHGNDMIAALLERGRYRLLYRDDEGVFESTQTHAPDVAIAAMGRYVDGDSQWQNSCDWQPAAPGLTWGIPASLHVVITIVSIIGGAALGAIGGVLLGQYIGGSVNLDWIMIVFAFAGFFAGGFIPQGLVKHIPVKCGNCGAGARIISVSPIAFVCRHCGHVEATSFAISSEGAV